MKEDMFRMLAEHSTDVISRHTPEGEYLYVSPSSKRVLGFTPEELEGQNVFALFHPDDMARIQEAHAKKKVTYEAETISYRIRTKNGNYKWVETISKIIPNPDTGEPLEMHAFTRDDSERKQYEEALKSSLRENKMLVREVHHRVKNNLALISGLLAMQKMTVDSPEFEKVATDCELRIRSISMVHEKLYKSANLASVDLESYIAELFENIRQIFDDSHEVDLQLRGHQVDINIHQAIPVALILNELITNSYKYAFRNGAEKNIKTDISEKEGIITVDYWDNGVGLPARFDYRQTSSMGFTIIRTLAKQLRGDLDVSSDNGIRVRLSFRKVDREIGDQAMD